MDTRRNSRRAGSQSSKKKAASGCGPRRRCPASCHLLQRELCQVPNHHATGELVCPACGCASPGRVGRKPAVIEIHERPPWDSGSEGLQPLPEPDTKFIGWLAVRRAVLDRHHQPQHLLFHCGAVAIFFIVLYYQTVEDRLRRNANRPGWRGCGRGDTALALSMLAMA